MTPLPDLSSLNSAVSLVNGISSNSVSLALIGPEYIVFGTSLRAPAVFSDYSFHGPSTTCQRGFV